jgi:hypothetical protein
VTRRRAIALACVWTLPSLLFLAITARVYFAFRISPPDRLGDAERTALIAPLRAAASGHDPSPCAVHPAGERLLATVWVDGRSLVRVEGTGADLGLAADDAAKQLRALAGIPERGRIQIDIIRGRAPLGGSDWLFDALAVPGIADMLALNPGLEGIGADIAGKPVLLLPHELVAAKLLATKRPSRDMQDFAIGADLTRIGTMLAARAGQRTPVGADDLYRFRTDTFVETPAHDGAPIQLTRGIPAPPHADAKTLRAAALAGGRYLVAHLAPNGRYIYEHDLDTGMTTSPTSNDYSMPRHAGVTYFLAELYRITKEEWLREPIQRAIAHLAELLERGHCGGTLPDGTAFDCVLDRNERVSQLGSTALAVVALAEYQRATGDTRYQPLATKLAAHLLAMQRDDGSFRHIYDPRTKQPDDRAMLPYYSGEASLALARMGVVTGDARYTRAAERGLDWLTSWYDFFLGGFVYFEEHWTCIAAEAVWPAVQKPAYKRFCDGYAEFLRSQQPARGDHPDEDDWAGAYGVTPFLVPYNTPAGSRSEAMLSTYLLDVHHGAPDAATEGQIHAALGYVLGQQIRPDSDFSSVGAADGGIPNNPIEHKVRIDYVQHVCSAMIRASEVFPGW